MNMHFFLFFYCIFQRKVRNDGAEMSYQMGVIEGSIEHDRVICER